MKEKKMVQKRRKQFLIFAVVLSLLCIPAILTPTVKAETWEEVSNGDYIAVGDELTWYRKGVCPMGYRVYYVDENGNPIQGLPDGERSDYDANSGIASHTVLGYQTTKYWKIDGISATADDTAGITFRLDPDVCEVIYKNGTTELQKNAVAKGNPTPAYRGSEPSKDADVQYTYKFSGWSPAVAQTVTADAVYTAQFDKTLREYQITWVDDEGNQIDVTSVAYGEVPTHADPTKDATADYTYTFKGWDTDPVAVTGPATYKAVFDAVAVPKNAEVKTTAATTEAKDASAPTGDTAPLAAAGALALASFLGAAALLLKKKA